MADQVWESHTAWGPDESTAQRAWFGWDGAGEPVVWNGVEEREVWTPDVLAHLAEHVREVEARAVAARRLFPDDLVHEGRVVELDPATILPAVARFRELIERGELVHDEPARFTATAADGIRRR